MRSVIVVGSLIWSSVVLAAAPSLRTVCPEDMARAGAAGKLVDSPLGKVLKIVATHHTKHVVALATIESPGIQASSYFVTGDVRHEGVEGKGYLEMWSHFPDGSRYFSRTLGSQRTRPLEGSSDWRPFVLPFHIMRGVLRPTRLQINLVLPGPGTVYLGGMQLTENQPVAQWWSDRMGGLVGAVVGVLGGLVGAAVGVLSSRGKAYRRVMQLMFAGVGVGAVLLLLGVVALGESQAYGVWYPLVLGGGILTFVVGGLIPVVRKRYQEIELRKMEALDAR